MVTDPAKVSAAGSVSFACVVDSIGLLIDSTAYGEALESVTITRTARSIRGVSSASRCIRVIVAGERVSGIRIASIAGRSCDSRTASSGVVAPITLYP